MAIDSKSLTVDFRSLLKMTIQERMEIARLSPSYLASLTPTQYAMLFPDYYRKQLPDLGLSKATSGATPLSTISGEGGGATATPLPRYDGTKPKTGIDAPPAPAREKPKPSSTLKETWDQRLIREAEERRRPSRPATGGSSLRAVRSRQMKELDDPAVRAAVLARAEIEVGSQPGARGPWLETVFNRAAATGKSLFDTVNNSDGYYPRKDNAKWKRLSEAGKSSTIESKFSDHLSAVGSGSNETDYATDNASSTLADQRQSRFGGKKINGELFYNNGEVPTYTNWAQKQRKLDAEEAKKAATKVLPDDAAKTGAVIPPDGMMKPEKTKAGKIKFADRTKEMETVNDGRKYGSAEKAEPYKFVGVHYTGGSSLSGALSTAKQKNEGYQYIIDRDGTVHIIQDPNTGRSNHWGGHTNEDNIHPEAKNTNSIGISFVGTGNKDITPEQRKAGLALFSQVSAEHGIAPENFLGHGEVSKEGHRENTEGYALLEPWRQMNGITPETGKVPNIAPEAKGAMESWKKGNYNYNLESLIPKEEAESVAPTVEPLKALPQGLDPRIVADFNRMDEAKQQKILESMTGVPVDTINSYYGGESATAQTIREKSGDILSGRGHPEDQWGYEPGRTPEGVDKQLMEALEATAKDFPLRVRFFSGKKDRLGSGSSGHEGGIAADIQIFDESGHPLSSYQDPRTANIYAMFAQRFFDKSKELHGEEVAREMAWLGGLSSRKGTMSKLGKGPGGYGSADWMDFRRIRGGRGSSKMNAWNPEKGWLPGFEHYTQEDFLGLGPIQRRFTEEEINNALSGFNLTDQQIEQMRERAKDVRSQSGYFNRLRAWKGGIGPRKYPVETVPPAAPPDAAVSTETQSNVTGAVVPEAQMGPPGASIIPETKPASTATATPINPPSSPAVSAAMERAGPPGSPTYSDYREDPAVKAEAAKALEASKSEQPKPKEMRYGGSTQSPSGEPFGAVDMKTGKLMFTHQPGEKIDYASSGQIKVTPNTRRDSEEIESLAQKVKDEVRLQSEAREAAAETPMTRISQQIPQNNPNWSRTVTQISEDSANIHKTASSGRAFDQARFIPRKDIFSLANATLKS